MQWKLNSLVYKRMSAKEFAIGIDYDDKSSDWLIDDGKEYSGGSSAWMLSLRHVCSDYHFILHNGQYSLVTVMSAGHSLHVFINGQLAGTVSGSVEDPRLTYTGNVKLWAGSNRIAILSISVGLPNVGEHFEKWNAGVFDLVTLDGLNEGRRGLSWQKWTYQNGLKGESLSLNTLSGSSSVDWQDTPEKQPLTWYKAFFNSPGGSEPLALDMSSMGKGQVQISG